MSTKVGVPIEIVYQAAGATSGLLDVTATIYDEMHNLDGVNFPDVTLIELGSTGRYYGSFIPDTEGWWTVPVDSATKPGKLVKSYEVVGHSVDSVGDSVAALNDLSAAEVYGATGTALVDYDAPTKIELDTAEASIRGTDGDTLKTISDQVDGLASPPMLG